MVASVAGLGGVGAGVGSMTFILATGWVVDHFGYTPVLTIAGALAPIGTIVLFALAGAITRFAPRSNDFSRYYVAIYEGIQHVALRHPERMKGAVRSPAFRRKVLASGNGRQL